MAIDAPIDGVDVHIDLYTVRHGDSSTTYTRVTAMAETPFGLTLRIHQEGFFSNIGKKLGMQDVAVGHPEFDDLFVVKASDEDLARAWLVPEVTELLHGVVSWSHRLEGGMVSSMCVGFVEDVGELTRAALAVARFAGRGGALRADWDRVAQSLGGVMTGHLWRDGAPTIALDRSGSTVRIELARAALPSRRHRTGLVTRVCAERSGATREPFVAARAGQLTEDDGQLVPPQQPGRFELRSRDPRATATRWDEGQRQTLEGLVPCAIVGTESEVAILFGGLMLDVERLRSAVVIARQLAAAPASGPYR